jgi:hypothetical protein
MTNEINDSTIKQSQSKILIENTNGHITNTVDSKDKKVNNNNNDDMCNADQFSPIPHQRRTKNNNNNNILLEIPLKSKRGIIQEESPNKKRNSNRAKVPNSKNPNIKNEKDEEKKNEAISPKRKAIFYNNKDYNILNLVHVTNKIYENEHHLNKGIIHKKDSYNSISLKDLINAGKISNAALKKNVVISVDLNDNNKHNHHHRHHKKKKTDVNKKSYSSKANGMKELNESQDKACLSNYTKIKTKVNNNSKLEFTELSNNEGEMTAKIHKRNFSKSKTIKLNNLNNDFLEDDPMKSKSKKSTRIYVNKDKKKESPISVKNQTNDIEIKNDALKNETADINKVNQKKEKSKLLSCLLCCFNSKIKNDSVDEL